MIALVACGPESGTSTEAASTSTTEEPSSTGMSDATASDGMCAEETAGPSYQCYRGADDPGCFCYAVGEPCCWSAILKPTFSCGQPQICPEFSNLIDPNDIDTARCILMALEARTPATHKVRDYQAEIDLTYNYEVLPDESVIRRTQLGGDTCGYDEVRVRLHDPSFYAECAALTEVSEMQSCFHNLVDDSECVAAPPVCP